MKTTLLKNIVASCFLLTFLIVPFSAMAQDDLLGTIQEDESEAKKDFVQATFKGTRVINFQTSEVLGKRTLDFRISHRFGEFNTGSDNAYGLDGPASIRIGLEYSYDGRLMAGFGRSSYQKQFDGFVKFRWLRQTENNSMPISLTLFTSAYATMQKDPNKASTGFDKYENFSSRMSFVHQVIVARKFSPSISAQIAPVMVHYNLVDEFTDLNDMFFIAATGRVKITKRLALTAEYAYKLRDYTKTKDYFNPLGIGIDIETGGHVFQMHVTNAFGIADNQFYPYNTTSWKDNGIRLGFNVSRVFTL